LRILHHFCAAVPPRVKKWWGAARNPFYVKYLASLSPQAVTDLINTFLVKWHVSLIHVTSQQVIDFLHKFCRGGTVDSPAGDWILLFW
jgi:hypothetical protein